MKMHFALETDFGPLVLLWEEQEKLRLSRIILPAAAEESSPLFLADSRLISPGAPHRPMLDRIHACLNGRGDDGELDVTGLNLTDFQKRVLHQCRLIPRGMVASYGTLAAAAGCPQGARAVGGAMGANPLPLLIPCHRVARSGGCLGDFGGGLAMKKALLVCEGVEFDGQNRVAGRFYYQ